MENHGHPRHPAGAGSVRPSLLGANTAAQEHNILDTVAVQKGRQPKSGRSARMVWLLLPVLAAAVWYLSTRPAQQSPTTAPAASPTDPQTSTPAPVPAAGSVVLAPAASEPPPTGSATVLTDVATPTDPFGKLASASEPPAPEPLPTSKSAAPAVAPAVQPSTTQSASQPASQTASKKPVSSSAGEVKKPSPAKTPVAARSAPNSKPRKDDPDVALLSAIMKHLDDSASPSARSATSERAAQTIAELVKSCQTKDAIEALLCQRRICEGSWGKAQACPMNLAPHSTTR